MSEAIAKDTVKKPKRPTTKPKKPKTAKFLAGMNGGDQIKRRNGKESFPLYKKTFTINTFEAHKVLNKTVNRYRSTYIYVLSVLRKHKEPDTIHLVNDYLTRSCDALKFSIFDQLTEISNMIAVDREMEYERPYDVEIRVPARPVEVFLDLIIALDSLVQKYDLALAMGVIDFEERDRQVISWTSKVQKLAGRFQSVVAKLQFEVESEQQKRQEELKKLIGTLSESSSTQSSPAKPIQKTEDNESQDVWE